MNFPDISGAKLAALFVVGGSALLLVSYKASSILYDLPFLAGLQDILVWTSGLGPLAPLMYAGLYLVGSVCFLPCFPLTIGAGFVFGFQKGFLIASLASTLGAIGAFLVSRYVARSLVRGWMEKNERYQALDRAVTAEGWKIVVLVRFASHLPYNVVNYFFGLTGISLCHFAPATWAGRLPITAFHTYVGSFTAGVTLFKDDPSAVPGVGMPLYFFGWLATLAVTVYLYRIASGVLAKYST